MKKRKLFNFRGTVYYAFDEDEVLYRYKLNHVIQDGEILHIGRKYFRVTDGKLDEIKKEKKK